MVKHYECYSGYVEPGQAAFFNNPIYNEFMNGSYGLLYIRAWTDMVEYHRLYAVMVMQSSLFTAPKLLHQMDLNSDGISISAGNNNAINLYNGRTDGKTLYVKAYLTQLYAE